MAEIDYAITFARSARKELERLDPENVKRIFPVIEALYQNPRPSRCRKLSGLQNHNVSESAIIMGSIQYQTSKKPLI
jgi:hypothetical protein